MPFEQPVGLAEKLRHALVHAHADGERVAVAAIGGDHVIIVAQAAKGPDRDRFLPDVEVEEAAHLALIVEL